MTLPDPDALILCLEEAPDEENDVAPDVLVAYGMSLLQDPAPTTPDEEAWRAAASNRLGQRFREALHGDHADPEVTQIERKSRP